MVELDRNIYCWNEFYFFGDSIILACIDSSGKESVQMKNQGEGELSRAPQLVL